MKDATILIIILCLFVLSILILFKNKTFDEIINPKIYNKI